LLSRSKTLEKSVSRLVGQKPKMLNIKPFVSGPTVGKLHAGLQRNIITIEGQNSNTVGAMSKVQTSEFESGSEWNPVNFDTVMGQYQSRIFRFIYAIVGETETAHDLTQDTFLNAYRNLLRRHEASEASGEYQQKPSDNMSAWLYTIARNTAFSEMRRRKIVRFFSFWQRPNSNTAENEFDGLADTPIIEPGGSLEARSALHDELYRAMDEVGRERLTALLLHMDGFSYKEICDITGDSLSSVKSQIFRAKESLRKALATQGYAEPLEGEKGGQL